MNKPILQKNNQNPTINQDTSLHKPITTKKTKIREKNQQTSKDSHKNFLNSLLRHNLKNKLCVITGYLQLLEDSNLSDEDKESLEKVKKAAMESSDLIEKVENLIKAEKNDIETVQIDSIITDIIDEREKQAEKNGMTIEYLGKNLQAQGGPLLKELFSNLIENSINHSEGETIRIWVWEKNQEIIVTVEDDGKGIPASKKDKIMKKGYKGSDSKGSGLGMHLSKTIADIYNGRLEIKDSELGGARFDVFLKKSASPS